MTRSLSDEENQDTEYSDEEEDHISESPTHLDEEDDGRESPDPEGDADSASEQGSIAGKNKRVK